MPDARYRIPDARYRIPDAGCRMPDAGCRIGRIGRVSEAGAVGKAAASCRTPNAGAWWGAKCVAERMECAGLPALWGAAMSAGNTGVAQTSSLLYRGFPTRRGRASRAAGPTGSRRYSRLETCATGSAAGCRRGRPGWPCQPQQKSGRKRPHSKRWHGSRAPGPSRSVWSAPACRRCWPTAGRRRRHAGARALPESDRRPLGF
jgi:hypothetical protein